MITRRRMLATTGGLAAIAAAGRAGAEDKLKVQGAGTGDLLKQHRIGTMQITRGGSQPSEWGPEDYFTGSVRIDSRF